MTGSVMVLDTEYHRKVMVLHLRSSQSQPFVFFTTHTYACPHGCKLSIRLSWCCYCPSNCLAFARPIATHPVFFIFSNHTGSQRRLVLLAVRAWSGVPTPTQQNTDSRSRTPPVRAFRNAIGVDSGTSLQTGCGLTLTGSRAASYVAGLPCGAVLADASCYRHRAARTRLPGSRVHATALEAAAAGELRTRLVLCEGNLAQQRAQYAQQSTEHAVAVQRHECEADMLRTKMQECEAASVLHRASTSTAIAALQREVTKAHSAEVDAVAAAEKMRLRLVTLQKELQDLTATNRSLTKAAAAHDEVHRLTLQQLISGGQFNTLTGVPAKQWHGILGASCADENVGVADALSDDSPNWLHSRVRCACKQVWQFQKVNKVGPLSPPCLLPIIILEGTMPDTAPHSAVGPHILLLLQQTLFHIQPPFFCNTCAHSHPHAHLLIGACAHIISVFRSAQ